MGIFEDFGIDYNEALSEPEDFSAHVHAVAAKMIGQLRSAQPNAKDYLKELPKSDNDTSSFDAILDAVYAVTEDFAIEDLNSLADKVQELSKTIRFAARSRAAQEIAKNTKDIDKPKVAAQYSELRETFNKLADMIKVLKGVTLPKLPAMPGNYAPKELATIMFVKDDYATANYLEVAKEMGMKNLTLMDVVEIIDEDPTTGWTYTKVKV